jgi:hypothetical protein
MPTFCRHNRFLANCPICSPVQMPAPASRRSGTSAGGATRKRATSTGRTGGVKVRHVVREQDDGFRSGLVPGIKASAAAERLAEEIAFAVGRLAVLATAPSELYREVAEQADHEEAIWLAFLIAYLGPLDGADPFAGVRAARVPWAGGELPALDDVALGPRTAHERGRGTATLAAYRAWAERSGSQQAAFAGEPAWTSERRFARAYERLALPGLHRDARFDLLVTLGQLGIVDTRPGALQLGGPDETTVAAKRIFGIADTLLLERRAADLANAADMPLAALDVGLWNWSRPVRPAAAAGSLRPATGAAAGRATLGVGDAEPDAEAFARVAGALGL